MSTLHHRSRRHGTPSLSANERFKRDWTRKLCASVLIAVAAHVAVFVAWPVMQVQQRFLRQGEPASLLSLANFALEGPELRLPAAVTVEALPEPALPTVEDLDLDLADDIDVGMPVMADPVADELIAPPVLSTENEWLEYEHFAPFMVAPEVRNTREVRRFLERHYQPLLERTGVSGVVQVHFWIDEEGGVWRTEIATSSGSRSLDRLAMKLSQILRFSPAIRAGRPVRVLVRLPITFRQI